MVSCIFFFFETQNSQKHLEEFRADYWMGGGGGEEQETLHGKHVENTRRAENIGAK